MDDFIPKSPEFYNYFHSEQTELKDTLFYEAQQQDPVFRQLVLWKLYKNQPSIPSLTIRANKGLLHYYRRRRDLSINETNHLLYNIEETTPPKFCLPISLLLVIFHVAHSPDLSGHPGREKTHATITENYYFPNIQTWVAVLTHDCLNCQTSKSMPNLLMAPQQPFLEVSPYFNHRISVDTNGPISPSSDGNSYVYVIVDAFTHYVVLHPSPKKDATDALSVLFDHWIVKFDIPDIIVPDNGKEYFNREFAHYYRTYNVQFEPRTPYAPWSNGLVENSNRQLNTFFRTFLDAQYDTWSQKLKVFPFAFNSQVRTNKNLSPYELVFGQNQKRHLMFDLSATTDSFGNCKASLNSPCNSLPKHTHTDHLGHHPQIKKFGKEPLHIGFSIKKRYTQKFITKFTIIEIKINIYTHNSPFWKGATT